MTTPPHDWDSMYTGGPPPPLDIGRPPPALVRVAEAGVLSGRGLDVGCGTGENTLLAASYGADAMGVDVAAAALQRARGKASERGVRANFEVADALALDQLGLVFDTMIDCGLFHVFDDADRAGRGRARRLPRSW